MRVAFLNPQRPAVALLAYSTKPRGGVVHTLALAEALAARGAAVTVWSLGRGGDAGFFRPVDPRVDVRVVPLPEIDDETVGERVLRSIATLGDALDVAGADVVHAQDCIGANAATHAGARCVRTVHHLDAFTTPQLAACHERALREPFAHVCVSDAVAAELAERGITATVIPNGVHAERFAAAVPAGRARPYVLTVGGIEPRKGSLELLEGYARLRTRADLVIAGGETVFDYREYRLSWEKRAAELGVTPVVLGAVPDAELPSLVAGAAAFASRRSRRVSGSRRWRRWPRASPSFCRTCRCSGRPSPARPRSPRARTRSPLRSTTRSSVPTPPGGLRDARSPRPAPGTQPLPPT
jgi:glycosyltransferase-like protein